MGIMIALPLVFVLFSSQLPMPTGARQALMPLVLILVFSLGIFAVVGMTALRALRGFGGFLTMHTGQESVGIVVETAPSAGLHTPQAGFFSVTLDVLHPDGSVYRAVARQPMTQVTLDTIAPGDSVPVRIDARNRQQVAIDVEKLKRLRDAVHS